MFQSNIKSETTYLQNVQEDCFYAGQNTSMRGKVVTHTLLIVIIYPVTFFEIYKTIEIFVAHNERKKFGCLRVTSFTF